jgi:prepilin-type N-terminal cleavage/methylation domain-containing protein
MKKAFTLIELLIVIAIIGILAGIVLVSLTGALKKGKDSKIQADLQQVRNIAGMIMTDEGGYDSLCASDNTLNKNHSTYGSQLGTIESDISAQGSTDLKCYASSTDYCVAAKLISKPDYYCIDSNGNALSTSTTANPCASASSKCK